MAISNSQHLVTSLARQLGTVLALMACLSIAANAQESIEWVTPGGDYAHTRYSPASEINADNFGDLEVAWQWDRSTYEGYSGRSTPGYINGRLYTVSGPRRHVVAIDLKTGEEVGRIEVPATSRYGMSSWIHDGHQYIILQTGARLTAMALPGAAVAGTSH